MSRLRLLHVGAGATAAAALLASALAPVAGAASLPPNFRDDPVLTAGAPTAIAFLPDGALLVATQPGRLLLKREGTSPVTALDLSAKICSNSERGLLGVAVDPQFTENRLIYLFYTFKRTDVCDTSPPKDPENRVSRFILSAGGTVDETSEEILLDNIPSPAGNHNGGDVHFGADGLLYVSVGDGGCDYVVGGGCGGANDAARDLNVLLGKILRITKDGGIPADNPFLGAGTAPCRLTGRTTEGLTCQETYAWGLRNPFRIAFDPNAATTRFFVNDVGQGAWEEIDLGIAGADYGWNVREGHCANGSTTDCGPAPAGMTNPLFDYGHTSGCRSITGGAFVPADTWPSVAGAYLYADFVCGTIFALRQASGEYSSSIFGTGFGGGSITALRFGPSPVGTALYYLSYAGGGEVRRIVPVPGRFFTVDLNGDGKDEKVVWRPSSGIWYVLGGASTQWGTPGDIPVPGNYQGDAADEIAVWRPTNGTWYVHADYGGTQWGQQGDIPLAADLNGDGTDEKVIYRPSDGLWHVLGGAATQWGAAGDIPVPGNYDADAADEIAVWRPSNGTWYVLGNYGGTQWGQPGDVPVPADYDGNGRDEFAVWRPSNGRWYPSDSYGGTQWGSEGDVPVPGDHDADAADDIMVWRPANGTWYVEGDYAGTQWGMEGDIP